MRLAEAEGNYDSHAYWYRSRTSNFLGWSHFKKPFSCDSHDGHHGWNSIRNRQSRVRGYRFGMDSGWLLARLAQ